ncbi:Transcription initiation factor TFIID subunit 12 [Astathelohania contejeani]|uniref:Transcription initiation factor TFIID subunit 12 n=1 Tax=Astathelohania contejeani TaxID=164912 RepID=A0ABQ7I1S5_9MICR|nr:Transcription initiation factor TFIID subunit 12 [Thelohania contejeani]
MSDNEKHFMPKTKLKKLNPSYRIDQDVLAILQQFSEKFIGDIINRTHLITKHRGADTMTADDIMFTIEKEFDYSFGNRSIITQKKPPTIEHVEKMIDINKQK